HHRPMLVAPVHEKLVELRESHRQSEGRSGYSCILKVLIGPKRYLPTYLPTYLPCTHDLTAARTVWLGRHSYKLLCADAARILPIAMIIEQTPGSAPEQAMRKVARYSFHDDYSEGAHPNILDALAQTNLS